jgi:lysophospholipase L1-like esterase
MAKVIKWVGKIDSDIHNIANYQPPIIPKSIDTLITLPYSSTSLTDINAIYSTEFDDLDGWSLSGAGCKASGGKALLAAGYYMYRTVVLPTCDYIWYFKIHTGYVADSSINFRLGEVTTGIIIYIDYDIASTTAVLGTITAKVANGIINLATGIDTSNYVEMVVQNDTKNKCVNFFFRNGSIFTFLGGKSYSSLLTGDATLRFSTGSGAGQQTTIDYCSVCKPNIIAIGDSVTKGAIYYAPNPDEHAGVDPYNNTFEYYCNVLSNNRNSLIVNKGVGGNDSADIVARIATDVVAHSPQWCILEAGLNDYTSGFTQSQRTTYIQNSVDLLVEANIRVVLTNSIIPRTVSYSYYQTWTNDYWYTISGADLYVDIMTGLADGDGKIATIYVEADNVHPNTDGYEIYGNTLQNSISGFWESNFTQYLPNIYDVYNAISENPIHNFGMSVNIGGKTVNTNTNVSYLNGTTPTLSGLSGKYSTRFDDQNFY